MINCIRTIHSRNIVNTFFNNILYQSINLQCIVAKRMSNPIFVNVLFIIEGGQASFYLFNCKYLMVFIDNSCHFMFHVCFFK